MMKGNPMHDNFKTHLLNPKGVELAREIAASFDALLEKLNKLGVTGRHLAIVATHLEDACFHAKKSIAVLSENQEFCCSANRISGTEHNPSCPKVKP